MIDPSEVEQMVEHLFRHESGKLVSVLTRIFGPENLELAEDVVQDSLVEAIKNWNYKGIPDNPSGWLFRVAKNKTLNIINREKHQRKYASDVSHFLNSETTAQPALDELFSEREVQDDQLRMIFTCCHPVISSDSQIAIALKTLCGFSIAEISRAFLSTEENINKRLVRARSKIRSNQLPFEIPSGHQLEPRLETVLETIYLLYNEGYSASSGEEMIRYEVCEEAIRLTEIIVSHPVIKEKSDSYALLSLMQLNTARFKARRDAQGNILTLEFQDRRLWDLSLMEKGFENLRKSISPTISKYHILASISAYHCSSPNFQATDWSGIRVLYDKLAEVDDSPVVLLNRAIAISKEEGAHQGIMALNQIQDSPLMRKYHLFFATKAELLIEIEQFSEAIELLDEAIDQAPIEDERQLLMQRKKYCQENV